MVTPPGAHSECPLARHIPRGELAGRSTLTRPVATPPPLTPDVQRRGAPRPDPVNSGFPPDETGGGGHTHTHTHTPGSLARQGYCRFPPAAPNRVLACSVTLVTDRNSDLDLRRANNTTEPRAAASRKVTKVPGDRESLVPRVRQNLRRRGPTTDGDDDNDEPQIDRNDTNRRDAQMATTQHTLARTHTHTHRKRERERERERETHTYKHI